MLFHNLVLKLIILTAFSDLTLQLGFKQASALIGRNGQGKSLLMALLAQQKLTLAYQGEIQWHCPHAYLPQLNRLTGQSIADALNITELADCFSRIENGDATTDDFAQSRWLLAPASAMASDA